MGLLVYLNDRKNQINISYAITACFIAFWSLNIYFAMQTQSPAEILFYNKLALIIFIFIPIPFIYFFSVFPKEEITPRTYQLTAWIILAGFFSLLTLSDLLVKGIDPSTLSIQPGDSYFLVVLYAIGFMFFAFWRLAEKYNNSVGIQRQQIRYVLAGFFLGFSFPVLANLILPLFNLTSLTAWGPLSTIFTVAAISYAITKTRLMDISVVISRTIAGAITMAIYSAIYLTFIYIWRSNYIANLNWLFIASNLGFALLIGETFTSLRLYIQTSSDKLILRGKYDYYKELSSITTEISKHLSMENILNTLHKAFYDIIEVANPRVYLSADFERPEVKPFLEIKEIKHQGEELIIPCLLEERLIALIVLGRKLSEEPFTEDDIRLLQVLASQTAIAIDHTATYENIRREFANSQKKLYDTERVLARSEKIASLANLIREYNHEIKTPLSIIRGETSLLVKEPRDLAALEGFKKLVYEQVDRANDIVESTLRLSQGKEHKDALLDLNNVIDLAIKVFPLSGVHLEKQFGPLPPIKGDQEDLQIAFVNLLKNAVEAMSQGGTINVKTYLEQGEKPLVCAEVADTGMGISPENLEKIFEPFFSTHVTKGRGLGLSIVFRIIREHLGNIEVKSQVGQGTTFIIKLPAS